MRSGLLLALLLTACAGGGSSTPGPAAKAGLAELLTKEYAVRPGRLDAPTIWAWEADAGIVAALRAGPTRAFARRLREADALDGDSLRLRGGPLFDRSPEILAALAAKAGMADLLGDLRSEMGYRLRTIHAADLVALHDDAVVRSVLLDADVIAGWEAVSRAGKFGFHPRLARDVIAVSLATELPAILERLRRETGLGLGTGGLPALASVVRAERTQELLRPRHLALLKQMEAAPGPPPSLRDLPGTLDLARWQSAPDVVSDLLRLGWRPSFADPKETEAVVFLAREARAAARIRDLARPDDHVGREAPLLSVRRLTGGGPHDPWLDAGDRAFARRLPDDGLSRKDLESAILAARGQRPLAVRPRTGYDESGRTLPFFSRPDLLRIRAIQRSLDEPARVARLVRDAVADRDDRDREHGGVLRLEGTTLVWSAETAGPGRRPAADGAHRLSTRPDPERVLATYHFHARGGAAVAGPSPGRVVGDLASARRLGVDGVILTLLSGNRLNVDFHDARGHVFDMGVYP